jgi:hypothetical protein
MRTYIDAMVPTKYTLLVFSLTNNTTAPIRHTVRHTSYASTQVLVPVIKEGG